MINVSYYLQKMIVNIQMCNVQKIKANFSLHDLATYKITVLHGVLQVHVSACMYSCTSHACSYILAFVLHVCICIQVNYACISLKQ